MDGIPSFGSLCTTSGGDIIAVGSYLNIDDVKPVMTSGAVIYDMASDGTLVWRRAYGDPFPSKYPGGSDALIAVLSPDGS